MQQQVSVITLATCNLAASKRFYEQGFGWRSVFENDEVVFYQMNGLMLGTWLKPKLEEDMQRRTLTPGAFALAHNVGSPEEVSALLERLVDAGGKLLRRADAPVHGGFRGYVACPDDHAWEIAFNPAWRISPEGYVTFGV